jgi:glycosyltransferase involved in cell wall biosynthesis
MYRNHTIGVVVPAYNEEKLIGETLAGMPAYVDRVYAVDDGSTDRTPGIIREFQKRDRKVVLIQHEKNGGVGAAIITGYKKALAEGISATAVMAGDNQMDPVQLTRLLNPLIDGMADYSKGNRLSKKEHKTGMSRWRQFGNFILSTLTKISSGYYHVQDPQNGYTAISRNALQCLNLDEVYTYYGYCNDLLARLNVLGMKVIEVDMPARYGDEKSKIKYGPYIRKVSFLLLRNFCWRLSRKVISFIGRDKTEARILSK